MKWNVYVTENNAQYTTFFQNRVLQEIVLQPKMAALPETHSLIVSLVCVERCERPEPEEGAGWMKLTLLFEDPETDFFRCVLTVSTSPETDSPKLKRRGAEDNTGMSVINCPWELPLSQTQKSTCE